MHMLMRHHTHLLQKIGLTVWVERNLCKLARIHTLLDALECGPGGVPGAGQPAWNTWYHPASALPLSSELMQRRLLILKTILLMALAHPSFAEKYSCSRKGKGVFGLCSA